MDPRWLEYALYPALSLKYQFYIFSQFIFTSTCTFPALSEIVRPRRTVFVSTSSRAVPTDTYHIIASPLTHTRESSSRGCSNSASDGLFSACHVRLAKRGKKINHGEFWRKYLLQRKLNWVPVTMGGNGSLHENATKSNHLFVLTGCSY